MRRIFLRASVAAAALLGLSSCGVVGDIGDTISSVQGSLEVDASDTESDSDSSPEDDNLGGLVAASENEDYLLEYRVDESQVTLWYLVINSQKIDGESIAMSVFPDGTGIANFTVLKAGDDAGGNPFSEIVSSTEFTPGLLVTPGPSGPVYTWTNSMVTWRIEADSKNRVKKYRMESPEGVFEMDFLYGSDITQRLPQAFIDEIVVELGKSSNDILFGVSMDDFQTWELYDF
jgi:hypothetical protein